MGDSDRPREEDDEEEKDEGMHDSDRPREEDDEEMDEMGHEDDEEEEISVIPYKYNGVDYLLEPGSKKVYNIQQEFVGKLVKKKIDFDAIDSDDEEE